VFILLVKFELEDSNGNILSKNRWQMEMDNSEILTLLQSKEIFYPRGDGEGVFCAIENTIFEVFQQPRFLEIILKEQK
jgi:hypothetical protein